jgi:hypothetical protein
MTSLPEAQRSQTVSKSAVSRLFSDVDRLAQISFITGLLCLTPFNFLVFLAPIIALVTGIRSLTRKPGPQGKFRVFAIVGLVTSALYVVPLGVGFGWQLWTLRG